NSELLGGALRGKEPACTHPGELKRVVVQPRPCMFSYRYSVVSRHRSAGDQHTTMWLCCRLDTPNQPTDPKTGGVLRRSTCSPVRLSASPASTSLLARECCGVWFLPASSPAMVGCLRSRGGLPVSECEDCF